MSGPEVVLDAVSKRFAAERRGQAPHAALDRVSLAVDRGEVVVVVGPSGCGKSTALRIVAGLEVPDEGGVSIAGRAMAGVPPRSATWPWCFRGTRSTRT